MTASRSGSIFRPQISQSTGLRQLCSLFFANQLHHFENEQFLENSKQLREIVAYATYVFGKSNDFLLSQTAPPSTTLHLPEATAASLAAKAAAAAAAAAVAAADVAVASASDKESTPPAPVEKKRLRRGSLDMRRLKLIEAATTKSVLPKGVPTMTETEFALSLCQHILPIVPKGSNAVLSTEVDPDLLQLYYAWFRKALPLIRLRDNEAAIETAVKANKSLASLLSPKNFSVQRSLPDHSSPPLNFLAKLPDPIILSVNEGWSALEVSDAISCIYESIYDDLNDPVTGKLNSFPNINCSLATATHDYFSDVFYKSKAICLQNLKCFCKGIVNHHNEPPFGTRIYVFAVLSGVIKLEFDVDKVVRHPEAVKMLLKVYKTFLPLNTNSAAEECQGGEGGDEEEKSSDGECSIIHKTFGSLLRTNNRRTMVPCIPSNNCVTFRTTVRRLLSEIPQSSYNNEANSNILLSDLEGCCHRYRGFYMIDVDILAMKILTYFCKSHGGFQWSGVDALHVSSKSRGSSRGSRGSRHRAQRKISRGPEHLLQRDANKANPPPPHSVVEVAIPTLPTNEEVALFSASPAGDLMKKFMDRVRHKIEHRNAAAREEQLMLEELSQKKKESTTEAEHHDVVDIFGDESTDGLALPTLKKKKTLPTISYPSQNLIFAFVNLKDKSGEEVSFEEFRLWSDTTNMQNSLSIILRSSLNQVFTVRAAPFDVVRDVIARSKIALDNMDKNFVLSHDGLCLDQGKRMIDYNIQNNACLRIWDAEEFDEFLFVQDQASHQDRESSTAFPESLNIPMTLKGG